MSIIDIFSKAIEIGSPDERLTFVKVACKDDSRKRNEVIKLLEQFYDPAPFMEKPAIEAVVPTGDSKRLALPNEKLGDQIGRYRLVEKIGEGGMGIIYLAEQETPVVRQVALKIVKWGMDTKEVLARFEAERQALALMDHPNIAKILDAGSTAAGRSFFVMELVQGIPITEYCKQNKLNTRARLELFIDVCRAVQHAHQKGIIHRDLKPGNVLIGVGMARRPPLPPNRTCGFPAYGSPVDASRLILQVAGLARLAVAKAFKEISPSSAK